MHILSFWYQVIVASEGLLEEAARLLLDEGWEAELKAFYLYHLEDERHHAKWLLEDMGGNPGAMHFGAATLAGMAYYLVRHVHPVALLGYMQALEGKPIDPGFIDAIAREYGEKATRTLRLHAEEDAKHIEELRAFPVPAEWAPLVENTRIQTLKLVEAM